MCMVYQKKRMDIMRGESLIESCRQKMSKGVQICFSSSVPGKVWVIIMPLRKWHCPTYFPANETVKLKGTGITEYIYWKSSEKSFSVGALPGDTESAATSPVILLWLLTFGLAWAIPSGHNNTSQSESAKQSLVVCMWFHHLFQLNVMAEHRDNSWWNNLWFSWWLRL